MTLRSTRTRTRTRSWLAAPLGRRGLLTVGLFALVMSGCRGGEREVKPKLDPARIAELTRAASLEKTELTLGFIKLTDCAPVVLAKELGYFEAEGLNVKVEAQANWKVVLDRVISGELDGAMMLAGQPIGAAVGVGGLSAKLVVPYVFDRHGNGITVSSDLWKKMQGAEPALAAAVPPHPISAAALAPAAAEARRRGSPLTFAMTFPTSTHNYELRYWLAAGGVHPGMYTASSTGQEGAEVLLNVTPPPQMPSTLEAGTIHGYAVGEPWNQQAVMKDIGVAVATSDEVLPGRIEKVLGLTEEFVRQNPETTTALVKALMRAGKWLDEQQNRPRAVEVLARKEYVGADVAVLQNSMVGTFLYQKSDRQERPDFNVFFRDFASYPFYSDAVWFLTQMRRWGQLAEPKPESFYFETARAVFRPELYRAAAEALIREGHVTREEIPAATDGFRAPHPPDVSGVAFDGRQPLAYLKAQKLGNTD
jgi:nitrate/nitrite transport system substrate-binding protein